jgi:hypothetical protein
MERTLEVPQAAAGPLVTPTKPIFNSLADASAPATDPATAMAIAAMTVRRDMTLVFDISMASLIAKSLCVTKAPQGVQFNKTPDQFMLNARSGSAMPDFDPVDDIIYRIFRLSIILLKLRTI